MDGEGGREWEERITEMRKGKGRAWCWRQGGSWDNVFVTAVRLDVNGCR
jgi:hypothetical protein